MNGHDIVQRVFDTLVEDDRTTHPTFTHAAIVRVLNAAQRDLVREIRDCRAGLLDTSGSLSVTTSTNSVALPSDLHSIRDIYDSQGRPIMWRGPRGNSSRVGSRIRLSGNSIVWDEALAASDTWTIDYVKRPSETRYGTLAADYAAGVILPVTDSGGALSTADDAYNGWSIGFLTGTAEGEKSEVLNYAGSTRVASVSPSFGTEPDSGDTYILMDVWPEEWSEVLAAGAALRLAREGQELSGLPYGKLLLDAKASSLFRAPAVSKLRRR